MIQFDWTLTLGNVITLLGGAALGGALFWRVGAIEKRMDDFIPRLEADAKMDAVRGMVNGVRREIDHLAEGHN